MRHRRSSLCAQTCLITFLVVGSLCCLACGDSTDAGTAQEKGADPKDAVLNLLDTFDQSTRDLRTERRAGKTRINELQQFVSSTEDPILRQKFDGLLREQRALSDAVPEKFKNAVINFAQKYSQFAAAVPEASTLVFYYSQSLDPESQFELLARTAAIDESLRQHIRSELWRLSFVESASNGWLSPSDLALVNERAGLNVARKLRELEAAITAEHAHNVPADSLLSTSNTARALRFRTMALSLMAAASLEPGDIEANRYVELLYVIGATTIALPDGDIAKQVYGQTTAWPHVGAVDTWLHRQPEKANAELFSNLALEGARQLARIREVENRQTATEKAVASLEQRFAEFQKNVTLRLNDLDHAVADLSTRLSDLEKWRITVDQRLNSLETRVTWLEHTLAPQLGRPLPTRADFVDGDHDGIDDRDEHDLLAMFAPVIKIDKNFSGPTERIGSPINAGAFLDQCRVCVRLSKVKAAQAILGDAEKKAIASASRSFSDPWVTLSENPTPQWLFDLRQKCQVAPDNDTKALPLNLFLQFRNPGARWGDGYPKAIKDQQGIYGRVWRPFATKPNLLSVQYYILLTFNWSSPRQPFLEAGVGDHEGDLLCLDFGVDIADRSHPHIAHAIYHNHGRQLFMKPSALEFLPDGEYNRPVAYLELGTNEPWPNAGPGGEDGWPHRDGFATNKRFKKDVNLLVGKKKVMDEHNVVAPHTGTGNGWQVDRNRLQNIGEIDPNGAVRPLCADGFLLLSYAGKWGLFGHGWELDLGVVSWNIDVDPPDGPVQNSKMWSRAYGNYPWGKDTDPDNPPTSGLITTGSRGF